MVHSLNWGDVVEPKYPAGAGTGLYLPDFKMSVSAKDLAFAPSAKDLGVVLDPQLTIDDYVLKTTSSCVSSLAQISWV